MIGEAGLSGSTHPARGILGLILAHLQHPVPPDGSHVEHRIARLVQLGIRQARYFGRRKTLFQVLLAAAVANLALVASQAAHRAPTIAAKALFGAARAVLQRLCGLAQSSHRLDTGLATIATYHARRSRTPCGCPTARPPSTSWPTRRRSKSELCDCSSLRATL